MTPSQPDQPLSSQSVALWDVDHPYYCSDSNYYVGGVPKPGPFGLPREDFTPYDHVEFASWDEFSWKDSDADLNLLFRWDWNVPDPDDYEDEEIPPETLSLYWMLQRKGRFMIVSFPVKRDEEPQIREWLAGRWEHMRRLWEPFA